MQRNLKTYVEQCTPAIFKFWD